MTAPALRTYPSAPRTDLVEDLHGHRVADPYRGLEDAGSGETEAWSTAQDELHAPYRESLGASGPFATDVLTHRLSALLGAGFVRPAGVARRTSVLRPTGRRPGARRRRRGGR